MTFLISVVALTAGTVAGLGMIDVVMPGQLIHPIAAFTCWLVATAASYTQSRLAPSY
jgi:hypothetical protein